MSSMRLYVLGPPRIERDGVPLELPYRKSTALIVYLAVTGERHTREALVTLLWPEYEPGRARANLRRDLSVLRQVLGDELLLVDRETVGLDRGGPSTDSGQAPSTSSSPAASRDSGQALWLDVAQFRRLLSTWREYGYSEGDLCPECLADLAEAVELYRGDFLAGFSLRDSLSFDEWQLYQTEELRQELGSALERLVRGHSAQAEYESAIPYARRWLALDPLREAVHRHLMQLYARTGQRAAVLHQYQECVRILEAELGLSPSRETTSLYERIRTAPADRGSPLFPAPPPRHNLPAQVLSFVGQEALLAQIAERLEDPQCRLLTLAGLGGSGKTRLAVEAAKRQLDRFPDGVYFVSLAPVQSVEAIVPTVARALDLAFYGARDPRGQLLDALRKSEMLLVLDNYEHLLEGADLVTDILGAAPGVRVLVTSRARLNIGGEQLLPVGGMDYPKALPEPETALDRYSAVQLFLSSARRVRPGWEPTARDLADVVRICRLVEGMPLAILLAASWVRMLTPAEIAAEIGADIGQGIDFLESDQRDLPERQRSMRAVFDHSWALLAEGVRTVFCELSVFRGGFTREAAQEVAGASLRDLMALVEGSLLERTASGRFEMHELLRQYGEEKLEATPGEWARARDRHCAYYAGFLHRREDDFVKGFKVQETLAEMDNIRAGWDWAVCHGKVDEILKSSFCLWFVYTSTGLLEEGTVAFGRAADSLRREVAGGSTKENEIALGQVLGLQSFMYRYVGDAERATQLAQEGLSLVRKYGVRRELALCELFALEGIPQGDPEHEQLVEESLAISQRVGFLFGTWRALRWLGRQEEVLRICREANDRRGMAFALGGLGERAYARHEYAQARQFFEEALAMTKAAGMQQYIGVFSNYLGDVALALGEHEVARAWYQGGLAQFRRIRRELGILIALNGLGNVALAVGDHVAAARHYREAIEIAVERHPDPYIRDVVFRLDLVAGMAALISRADAERAVELAALSRYHPSSGEDMGLPQRLPVEDMQDRAQRLLDRLRGSLSPAVFAAAEERGRARDLEATMAELLAELESADLRQTGNA